MARLNDIRREIGRGELWSRPALGGVGAFLLAFATIAVDRAGERGSLVLPHWLEFGSADDVRTVLTTVATTSLTVVTLLASLTLIALSFASATVGPRQIKAFLRDRVTQATVTVFVGTFVYCLVVLVAYRGGARPFVPHVSALTSLVLALVSTALLVTYFHNLTRAVQPARVLVRIVAELDTAIREYGQGRSRIDRTSTTIDAGELQCALAELPEPSVPYFAIEAGYVQEVEHDRLMAVAHIEQSVIRFRVRPGHFVMVGEPVADVWNLTPKVAKVLDRGIVIGPERTLTQDLEFAIDQLAEVAIRALSPAINDTFTALACINWMGEALRTFATRDAGTPVHRDAAAEVRVIDRPVRFRSLVTAAFAKVRQAGATSPAVLMRLLEIHGRLAPYCNERQCAALADEALATAQTAALADFPAIDADGIVTRARDALEALGHASAL